MVIPLGIMVIKLSLPLLPLTGRFSSLDAHPSTANSIHRLMMMVFPHTDTGTLAPLSSSRSTVLSPNLPLPCPKLYGLVPYNLLQASWQKATPLPLESAQEKRHS